MCVCAVVGEDTVYLAILEAWCVCVEGEGGAVCIWPSMMQGVCVGGPGGGCVHGHHVCVWEAGEGRRGGVLGHDLEAWWPWWPWAMPSTCFVGPTCPHACCSTSCHGCFHKASELGVCVCVWGGGQGGMTTCVLGAGRQYVD